MNDETPLHKIEERLNRQFSDELGDCVLWVDEIMNGEYYRVRVAPEDHSYESDIGPAFSTIEEMRIFLRGLEYARDIPIKADNS
jgi:hypothetical protein